MVEEYQPQWKQDKGGKLIGQETSKATTDAITYIQKEAFVFDLSDRSMFNLQKDKQSPKDEQQALGCDLAEKRLSFEQVKSIDYLNWVKNMKRPTQRKYFHHRHELDTISMLPTHTDSQLRFTLSSSKRL